MAIVIIGGGIIGTATAYYLSLSHADPRSIHIIESAPRLFASASGYAGGFLAKDWFSTPVAPLGALSFDLHKKLAAEHDGVKRWGYASSTALSLAISEGIGVGKGPRGEDWLLEGTSRAGVAAETDTLNADGSPAWITRQKGGSLETISSEDGCAQVEPLQLSQFLMEACRERGVQLHMPTKALEVTRGSGGTLTGIMLQEGGSSKPSELPCTSIVITAGAWTPSVFSQLFPDSTLNIPIEPLAGHSIVVRSPRHTMIPEGNYGRCHAVFAAPSKTWTFAPEAISRSGGEIYVAGLNSSTMPLPELATDSQIDEESIRELKKVTVQLIGLANTDDKLKAPNEDDLEVTREGLCFRPVSRGGKPIITMVPDRRLGKDMKTEKGGGLFVAAGHGPWGISLSLGTGLVVAEMVRGVKTSAKVDGLGMRL